MKQYGWQFLFFCILCLSSVSHANTLRVAVVGGFSPAFLSLVPQLSHRIGMPIEVVAMPVVPLYEQLASDHSGYDLVINSDQQRMQKLVEQQRVLPQSVTLFAQSPVVLWCPNTDIHLRVRPQDTLNNPLIRKIALSRNDSPMAQLVNSTLLIPPAVTALRTEHALAAWRAARNKHVDCAFTLLSFMQPQDHYQLLGQNKTLGMLTAIPHNSRYPQTAQQIISTLNSPIIREKLRRYGYL